MACSVKIPIRMIPPINLPKRRLAIVTFDWSQRWNQPQSLFPILRPAKSNRNQSTVARIELLSERPLFRGVYARAKKRGFASPFLEFSGRFLGRLFKRAEPFKLADPTTSSRIV